MLRAILNKSWQQHPTRHQLYGHLPPIMKTMQVRQTKDPGHCWRSRDELISDVLRWTPTYGRAKAGWPAQTYSQQLCEDAGCSSDDLPEAMNDKEKWRERVRDVCAKSTTWWWWWWWDIYIYIYTSFWFRNCIELQPDLFLSANWTLVRAPRPINVIIQQSTWNMDFSLLLSIPIIHHS